MCRWIDLGLGLLAFNNVFSFVGWTVFEFSKDGRYFLFRFENIFLERLQFYDEWKRAVFSEISKF